MKRSHGSYSKQSRNLRSTGRMSVRRQLLTFGVGDTVRVSVTPVYKRGKVHLRFNGRVGVVLAKQGAAYVIQVLDGGKKKKLVVGNVHLTPVAKAKA
jgi:large subunit ribosomal protein L21e